MTRKLYSVRYYRGNEYSKALGYKGRLIPRPAALRVVRRLKRGGLFAIAVPYTIKVRAA